MTHSEWVRLATRWTLHDHESDCTIKNVELERHGHECGLF